MVLVGDLLAPLFKGGVVPLLFFRPVQADCDVAEKDGVILVVVHLPLVAAAIGNLTTRPLAAIKRKIVLIVAVYKRGRVMEVVCEGLMKDRKCFQSGFHSKFIVTKNRL